MPAMISVYCKRSVASATPDELLAAIHSADVAPIAESRYLWPGLLEDALARVQITNAGSGPFDQWELRYQATTQPQCVICRELLIAGAHDPQLDELRTLHHPGVDQIRRHLAESLELITLGFPQDRDQLTTAVIASEAARWIAETGEGIITRVDNTWWELDELGAYRRILP